MASSGAILVLASIQFAHAAVTVCVKSAELFKCDGQTPYGWDAFPYISFNGRLHYVCDGDPIVGVSYVRYDTSSPTWNMCCTWPGTQDLFTSFDVKVKDRETGRNLELGAEQYQTLPEPNTTLELKQELHPSTTVLDKLHHALWNEPKQGLHSVDGDKCNYGYAIVTVSVDWPAPAAEQPKDEDASGELWMGVMKPELAILVVLFGLILLVVCRRLVCGRAGNVLAPHKQPALV